MQFFGHVGIAMATTIAAFVSLFQYLHGLKKRGFWSFEHNLIIKTGKILFISLLMGICVYAVLHGLIFYKPLTEMSKFALLFTLGGLGIFALAFFAPVWYHIRAARAAIQVSLENHLRETPPFLAFP